MNNKTKLREQIGTKMHMTAPASLVLIFTNAGSFIIHGHLDPRPEPLLLLLLLLPAAAGSYKGLIRPCFSLCLACRKRVELSEGVAWPE